MHDISKEINLRSKMNELVKTLLTDTKNFSKKVQVYLLGAVIHRCSPSGLRLSQKETPTHVFSCEIC